MSGHWPPDWEDQEEEFPGEADQLEPDAEARLAEVTAYLSSVPAPVMPDGIESRISAALAAEAAGRAAAGRGAVTGTAATGAAATRADSATQADGATTSDHARPVGPAPALARVRRHRGGGGPRLGVFADSQDGRLAGCLPAPRGLRVLPVAWRPADVVLRLGCRAGRGSTGPVGELS